MLEKVRARIRMLVMAGVPLTSANLRKIQLPVPRPTAAEDRKRLALQHVEDLISMSNGQVWLDAEQGRSPPLDPSRSITRVGVGADTRKCRADAPALRSVVGSLRFEFQQAMDLTPGAFVPSSLIVCVFWRVIRGALPNGPGFVYFPLSSRQLASVERNDQRAAQGQSAMPGGIEHGEEGCRRNRRILGRDDEDGSRRRRGKSLVGREEADRDIHY